MEVSDEMVEALFGALGFDKAQPNGPDAVTRVVLGNALRAALAVMPDQYRVGWLAGRDAAAQLVDAMRREKYPDNDFRTIRARIVAMEPPA